MGEHPIRGAFARRYLARTRIRRTLVAGLAGTVGATMTVPLHGLAPAHAVTTTRVATAGQGLLDLVLDPVLDPVQAPVPSIVGAGTVTGMLGYTCSGTVAGEVTACPAVTLPTDGVAGLTEIVLTAEPAEGFEAVWGDTCPEPVGNACHIPTDALTDLITPVVTFEPLPGQGTDAPDTTITNRVASPTSTAASFTFAATPTAATPAYECRLATATEPDPAWERCDSGAADYTGLEGGSHTFEVRALDGDVADPTPAAWTWAVRSPASAPQTRIVSGPAPGAWVLRRSTTYRYTSTSAESAFSCRLDGAARACGAAGATLGRQRAGRHVFSVAAYVPSTGGRDLSPATRSFVVPFDDRALARRGTWRKRTGAGHFHGTFLQTRRRQAVLSRKAAGISRLALVADRGRGHGTVKVYLGTRLLSKVSLASRRGVRGTVVPVASFAGPRRGTVRVVVVSAGKTVRIDGLAIATR